ncbi:hypothetical protein I309_05450 [Cryptococcus deuterogattii LA55]|nr:hypothetical protein I309_05450 [Cryptococcus deuterogattii LA55]KIR94207.1 hypothetical protein I304_01844 [Cryptococcus deuterogattii CBS 10090]
MYPLPTQSLPHIDPLSHPSSPLPAAFLSSSSRLRDVSDEQVICEPIAPETRKIHYLALDTNILISYLNTVRTLHTLLSASVDRLGLLILIPIKVIQEIDDLKHSRKLPYPDSPVHIGHLARLANTWLLETYRIRREGGLSAVRCQSLKERYDRSIIGEKGDDDILDCCMYFDQHGARVVLWTNDKNLSLKAETNNIRTLGGHSLSLSALLKDSGADLPSELLEQAAALDGDAQKLVESPETHKGNSDIHMNDANHMIESSHNFDKLSSSIFVHSSNDKPKFFADLPPIFSQGSRKINQVHTSPQADTGQRRYPLLSDPGQDDDIEMDKEPLLYCTVSPPRVTHSASSTRHASPIHAELPSHRRIARRPSSLMLSSLRISLLSPTLTLISHPSYAPHISSSPPPSTLPTASILSTLLSSLASLDSCLSSQSYPIEHPLRLSLMRGTIAAKTIQKYIEYHESPQTNAGTRRIKTNDMFVAVNNLRDTLKDLDVHMGEMEVLDDFKGYD